MPQYTPERLYPLKVQATLVDNEDFNRLRGDKGPRKVLIASWYFDETTFKLYSHARNVADIAGRLYQCIPDPLFLEDHTSFCLPFTTDPTHPQVRDKSLVDVEDYFRSRNLVIPPSYNRARHLEHYTPFWYIFRLIFWISYPITIPFEKVHDILAEEFLCWVYDEERNQFQCGSNICIVPLESEDYGDTYWEIE